MDNMTTAHATEVVARRLLQKLACLRRESAIDGRRVAKLALGQYVLGRDNKAKKHGASVWEITTTQISRAEMPADRRLYVHMHWMAARQKIESGSLIELYGRIGAVGQTRLKWVGYFRFPLN